MLKTSTERKLHEDPSKIREITEKMSTREKSCTPTHEKKCLIGTSRGRFGRQNEKNPGAKK
jgi:hypothetical protein